ncbi:MAG: YdeI/OmpD-associated family protein [Rhodanobacteraceae bacterium]|nr:YdeI/OmpD-associated family protein [Rhodanobacteraceae bacterium]
MGKRIPEVDDYIAGVAPFAQPILKKLRTLAHKACPKAEERMRWSAPWFDDNGQVFGMGSFKAHAAVVFWRAKELPVLAKLKTADGRSVNLRRIESVADLPSDDAMIDAIRSAAALNAAGPAKKAAKKVTRKPPPSVPDDLRKALNANGKAAKAFDAFAPSHQREYVDWITEAKREETRQRRLAQAIEWLAEGKRRNWKYENC